MEQGNLFQRVAEQASRAGMSLNELARHSKRAYIVTVLREEHGNQCRTARRMGEHRNTLSRQIEELEIDMREIRKLPGRIKGARKEERVG